MNKPEPTAAEILAQENRLRKQAAGRLGAALMMVPLGFGLLVLWAIFAGLYIEDKHWHQGLNSDSFREDVQNFGQGPIYALLILHSVLVLSAWYFGRMAGIHVFYRGKRTFGASVACFYCSTWPSLILFPPLMIGFTGGWDDLSYAFRNAFSIGVQIGGILSFTNLLPALILGGMLGILLARMRKRQGNSLRMLEWEPKNGDNTK